MHAVATARTVLVVGPRSSGKTGYVRAVAERARAAGLGVAGFASVGEWEDGTKARFHLEDLADSGRRLLLASVHPDPGLDLRTGRYHLSSAAFEEADRLLRTALDADVVCMDEIGPLELRGGGFRPGLEFMLANHQGILVLTCRPRVTESLRRLVDGRR